MPERSPTRSPVHATAYRRVRAAAWACCLFLWACGGSSMEMASRHNHCSGGATTTCQCEDGASGVRSCTLDGDAYGVCQCAPGDGAAGDGGPGAVFGDGDGDGDVVGDGDGRGGEGDGDGDGDAPVPPPPAPPELALPAGQHTLQIEHGGRTRTFDLVVPEAVADGPVPLVVSLHGFTQERVEFEGVTLYGEKGAREGFAVATPDGVDRSWNGGIACCGNASALGIDDVGFIRALVQEVRGAVWVDPGRVYAAGFSNGSFLAHRLACEAADVFAAVAGAAGGLSLADVMPTCAPGRGVPVVTYFGTADSSFLTLSQSTADRWMEVDACQADGDVTYRQGPATCTTYRGCRDGAELTRCIVDGMDHCWPGGTCLLAQTLELDATDHSWEFFSRFSR